MAKISVIAQTVPNIHFTGVSAANPPHMRVIANQSFTTSTGERIEFGSVQGNALIIYLDVACTMSGTTVTVPQFTIDSTLDSPDNPNATYSFYWYRPLGNSFTFIGPVDGMATPPLQVPATIASASGCSPAGTCCNWTDLIIFNQGSIPLPLADFYTKPQVDAKIIANLAAGAPATATYIVKTATGSLTNAQSLGLLTTGLLKNTVGGITGTLSTAVADTDFQNALSVTAPLTLVVGPPDTLAMTQASSGVSGFLLGADWTTFNNKANAALSNLSAVAVNASLIPGAAGTLNLGSTALPWLSLIIGNGAANSATFTGTFTANRSVFVPDAASSLGTQFTVVSHQFLTSFSATTGLFTAAQPAFTDISGSATGAQMPATVVQTNQANTYTTGAQDFSAATSLKIPVGAGLQPAVNGQIAYDSTANRFGGGQNSVYATFLTPASTDTLTNKTWNGVVIGTQFGGLGANESAASGVLSLNAGAVVNNSITTNGVAFGAAGNTLSFTSAVANALVTTSAGSVPATVAPNATNFTMAAGVLNTIQNIATASTPQFAGLGINQAAPTIGLGITGRTINTDADQTVGSLQTGLNLIKNDANTRTFYDTILKPTINAGASNTTTTVNVLYIDTVNTALTGTTVNLLSLNFGGVNKYTFNSSGVENVAVGYQIGGVAASGNVLRGNGTNFVAAVLAAADLSNGVTGSGLVVLATAPTLSALTLTAQLTVPNGGTGATTFTSNGVLYGAGAGAILATAQGAANSVLTANAGAPSFSQAPTINTSLQIGVPSSQTGSLIMAGSGGANTQTFKAATTPASANTYVWPAADPGAGTVLQATAPAGGVVTLSWATGAAAAAGGSNTQMQYNASGALGGMAWTYNSTNQSVAAVGAAISGGANLQTWTPGAHTAVVSETIDLLHAAHTMTVTTGYALQRFTSFAAPTISAATAQTVTDAATVAIAGAPIATGAGPAIITNTSSLLIQDGAQRWYTTSQGDKMSWDPYRTGNPAPLLQILPKFQDGNPRHLATIDIVPSYGTLTSTNQLYILYAGNQGFAGNAIPNGTKGQFSVFEVADLESSQSVADSQGGANTDNENHGFGFTGIAHGSLGLKCIDAILTNDTVSSHLVGSFIDLHHTVAPDAAGSYGYVASSDGGNNATAGFKVGAFNGVGGGSFIHGGDWGGHDLIGITNLAFATSAGVSTGWQWLGSTANQGIQLIAGTGTYSAEVNDLLYPTRTLTIGAGFANERFIYFQKPSISGAFTVTNAATVAIQGAPSAIGGATITNAFTLRTESGPVQVIDTGFAGGAFALLNINDTQTQANSAGTDSALSVFYILTQATATNQLLCQPLNLNITNNLTTGGAIQNMRGINFTMNTNAGTSTGATDDLYIQAGTQSGTMTGTHCGIRIASMQTGNTGTFAVMDETGTGYSMRDPTHFQFMQWAYVTEATTILAAATTSTTFNVPANAVVYAVSVRVITTIPTAATFTVTISGTAGAKTFNTAAVSTAANATDPGTAAGAVYQGTTAQHVVITPNATPGAATGVVRVTAYYYISTPPLL